MSDMNEMASFDVPAIIRCVASLQLNKPNNQLTASERKRVQFLADFGTPEILVSKATNKVRIFTCGLCLCNAPELHCFPTVETSVTAARVMETVRARLLQGESANELFLRPGICEFTGALYQLFAVHSAIVDPLAVKLVTLTGRKTFLAAELRLLDAQFKEKTVCFACGKTTNLKTCNRCKKAVFCSKQCQTANWAVHKLVCDSFPPP